MARLARGPLGGRGGRGERGRVEQLDAAVSVAWPPCTPVDWLTALDMVE